MTAQENQMQAFGGEGQTLHFAHANGYPPGAYSRLLEPLTQHFRVVSAPARPLWRPPHDPAELTDWSVLADDLLAALDADKERDPGQPVVAVGHSLGAFVSLMAAAKRPAQFSALVLIEPAFLAARYRYLLQLFRRFGPYRIPLVAKTLHRRDHWDSEEEVFAYYRPKRVFAGLSDDVLRDYVRCGTRPSQQGGRTLTFSKEWEAQIYLTISNHIPLLKKCRDLPVLALRGGASDTLRPDAWRQWQAVAPRHRFREIAEHGHLLPLEAPDQVAAQVMNYLLQEKGAALSDPDPSR